jgi:hypothetical protein
MPAQPAIRYQNLLHPVTTRLEVSSAAIGFPVVWVFDQLRSKVWRSALGWTITTENNKLDFVRSGIKVATITTGQYSTGAVMAAAVLAALEVADPTPVWAVTYDATTHKFTISSDLAFTLLNLTGVNVDHSVYRDLGYPDAATGSAISHTAANVAYQSRQVIEFDLGSTESPTAVAIIDHNFQATGLFDVVLQGADTTLFGVGYILGTIDQVIVPRVGQTGLSMADVVGLDHRYWRLLINDVQNPDGYVELGHFFLGAHELLAKVLVEPTDERDELSQITYALEGAHYQMQRPTRRGWEFEFVITDAEKAGTWEPFAAAVRAGRNFLFTLDSADSATTRYVYLDRGMSFRALPDADPLHWRVKLSLLEALG